MPGSTFCIVKRPSRPVLIVLLPRRTVTPSSGWLNTSSSTPETLVSLSLRGSIVSMSKAAGLEVFPSKSARTRLMPKFLPAPSRALAWPVSSVRAVSRSNSAQRNARRRSAP